MMTAHDAPLPAARRRLGDDLQNGSAIRDARQKARARLHAAIPAHYSPWLHLSLTVGIGVAALAVAIARMHRPTLLEWLVVPITFVVANLAEWRAHKDLLHHRMPGFTVLYDRHTPEHHMVFGYDDMAIRDAKELRLVLIPAFGVFGIVLATAPLAWVLGHFVSANVGWLFLVTCALYVVGYEVSHMSYHLPEDSFIGRLGLVRVLREQHRRHHHPRLMQKWNFNVTIPLGDLLHRTMVPRDVLESTLDQDRAS